MFYLLEKAKYPNGYMIFVRKDGMVYNPAATTGADGYKPLAVHSGVTYANCAIRATDLSGIGILLFTTPAALPPGEYVVVFRNAVSPVSSDTIVKSVEINWGGSNYRGFTVPVTAPAY